MANVTRRKLIGFTGGIVAGTGVLLAGDEAASSNSPYHFQNIPARELIHQRHLPNVELITQNGKKVRFYDDLVRDKKFVIQFMFTHCTEACPMITHHLVEVQKLLNGRVGRDVFFYSITLSPEEDSSRDMKAYARAHGAGKGWLFLTGKPDDILHLRRSLGFTYDNPKEDADRNNHSGMLRIGNEQLTRWASCQGGARPEWIATVIRTELDSPFLGAVDGVRLADSAARKK